MNISAVDNRWPKHEIMPIIWEHWGLETTSLRCIFLLIFTEQWEWCNSWNFRWTKSIRLCLWNKTFRTFHNGIKLSELSTLIQIVKAYFPIVFVCWICTNPYHVTVILYETARKLWVLKTSLVFYWQTIHGHYIRYQVLSLQLCFWQENKETASLCILVE